VRTRRRGDRFVPLGLGEETRVGRFMINARIPRNWRDNIPLVVADKGIAWVVGYRIEDRFKVTEGTKRVLYLEFKKR
jgi:tRNA(Ile)-lysidine synthase